MFENLKYTLSAPDMHFKIQNAALQDLKMITKNMHFKSEMHTH